MVLLSGGISQTVPQESFNLGDLLGGLIPALGDTVVGATVPTTTAVIGRLLSQNNDEPTLPPFAPQGTILKPASKPIAIIAQSPHQAADYVPPLGSLYAAPQDQSSEIMPAPAPMLRQQQGRYDYPQATPVQVFEQQVPRPQRTVNPELQQTLSQQQQLIDSMMPAALVPPPPPGAPQLIGFGNSSRAKLQRFAGSLNPRRGQQYNQMNIAALKAAQDRYEQNMQNWRHAQSTVSSALNSRAGELTRLQTEQAKAEEAWQKQRWEATLAKELQSRLDFIARSWPAPSPERTAYIRDQYVSTSGAINLWPYVDRTFAAQKQMLENREFSGEGSELRNQYARATQEERIETARNRAQITGEIAKLISDTRSAKTRLAAIQAEKANLDYSLKKKYGEAQASAQLQLAQQALTRSEQKAAQDLRTGANNLLNGYMRAMSVRNNAIDDEDKEDAAKLLQSFGPTDKTTGIPSSVMEALNTLQGGSANARPKAK